MARWTTDGSMKKKQTAKVKRMIGTVTTNKFLKNFAAEPTSEQNGKGKPGRQNPGPGVAEGHYLTQGNILAQMYQRTKSKTEELVKKQEKAPKKLKARGFSAVAAHSAQYDYMVEPAAPEKPLKYDYTKQHPSWVARLVQRAKQGPVFHAFAGTHTRLAPVEEAPANGPEVPQTVYVGGIVPGYLQSKDRLLEVMAPFGRITACVFKQAIAFVTYARREDADRAVQEVDRTLFGRADVTVEHSKNEANACFNCGQSGHWSRDCPKVVKPKKIRLED
mmetsp:Transcript_20046/g.35791  ORF Transcript_20046/g.35791 Transcript_20046/m.35791 type:complete len:276 (-) Transcript_20046:59-886(-)